MTFIYNDEIRYSDSPNIDAFGRLRVSDPYNLFNASFVDTSGNTYYETVLTGGGTSTFDTDKSEVQFSVSGSGDRVLREQHGYNHYQPGKSQLVLMRGKFGSSATGVIKRMGYYNDDDGLMFELSGSTFGVKLRTSTSGAPVDTFIPQSEWNIGTLNTGTTLNPSGYHLDISKTNIYIINFQWLGVGRVVFALDIDGIIVPVHAIGNANSKTEVYMKTGNLPVRYEVTSSSGSDSTFSQICASVISEGGQQEFGFAYSPSNGLTTRTFSTRQSLISVRLANTFKGKTNRTSFLPVGVDVLCTSNAVNAYWELVVQRGYLGENSLGGTATWTAISDTPIEFSVNGTTVTGGKTIASGYVTTGNNNSGIRTFESEIKNKIALHLNESGTTSDWLHLVITPSVSSDWSGSINVLSKY